MFFPNNVPAPNHFFWFSTVDLILAIVLPVAIGLLLIPPAWKLCGRAGFPRWFSFVMLIPLANLALLYFIVFSPWPTDLRSVKAKAPDGDHEAKGETPSSAIAEGKPRPDRY